MCMRAGPGTRHPCSRRLTRQTDRGGRCGEYEGKGTQFAYWRDRTTLSLQSIEPAGCQQRHIQVMPGAAAGTGGIA